MWLPTLSESYSTKYEQIVHALEQDIAAGRLKPGDRLPPQRKLAKALAMTTGTIGRAYSLAEKRGLVKSEVGRGAFVMSPSERSSSPAAASGLVIDLGLNLPPEIHDAEVYERTLLELSRRRNLTELFGAVPVESFEHHRIAAARWLSPRIACGPDDVVICTGTQNALVSSLTTLTQPGDSILVESLTFPGILTAARLLRLNLIPVAMDNSGLIPEDARRSAEKARAIYINPTNHNPTSSVLNLARRRALADVARKTGLWIIEDDAYGHFFEQASVSVASLAPERSILIASLSKTMSVGLRLAFLYAPANVREKIVSALQATSFFPSPLAIEIASRWVEDGTAQAFIQKRMEIAKRRQAIASEIFEPDWIAGTPGLNHLWLRIPDAWTTSSLGRAAMEAGVVVFSSEVFAANEDCVENSVRIALGAARTDEELKVGLSKIHRLLAAGDAVPPVARF